MQLSTVLQKHDEEISALYIAKESAEVNFESEHDEKVLLINKARDYKKEADELRKELEEKDRKKARMSYIHESARKDFKLKVACYSNESGQTRHTISRDTVAMIANEKYKDTVMHY